MKNYQLNKDKNLNFYKFEKKGNILCSLKQVENFLCTCQKISRSIAFYNIFKN